ncbi:MULTISPECIES: DUF427 domain-containing protein [Streptomyces]|uniref:DUF427 domain-containing protein n=1 Tax=Streptomyces TaxID=1883 RepID=UPI00211A4C1D|nr:DUF427 domain-containing protein [Streptomyces hilarionis]MCQ9130367.1 DUF427 domain-containing protein [Streptomyces hilarionis]
MPSHETTPTESVWEYPRPPALRHDPRRVVVACAGEILADTVHALKIMETSHPPVFYVPPGDVRTDLLRPAARHTWCEWKGGADYWDVVVGSDVRALAAWSYPDPRPPYEELAHHFAFYAGRVDRCTVDGHTVQAQEGDFYGGWITPEVRGPFKGGAGTRTW